jgi:hypothetical protein
MVEYTITMNEDLCHETLKAVELLMRLKINQPEEIARAVMQDSYYWVDGHVDNDKFNDFIKRRNEADVYTRKAFEYIFPNRISLKDEEWYRLYNIYQVLRKGIHDAEHPESKGVDSYSPIRFTEEPLPDLKWKKQ